MKKQLSNKTWLLSGILMIALLTLSGCAAIQARAAGSSTTAPLANSQTTAVTRGILTAVVGATGSVRSSQNATIAWQTSGKVGQVLVQSGQQVQANEVLAALDTNTVSQNIIQAQTDLINAQTALDDLKKPQPLQIAQAETALSDAKTALSDLQNPSETAISQAQLGVITAQTAVTNAQTAVNQLTWGRGDPQQIAAARANYLLAQQNVDHLQTIFEQTHGSPSTDPAKAQALSNLEGAKLNRDQKLATLNWFLGKPTASEVAQKNTQLALAQAQLADAQTKLAQLKNPTPDAIALAQAKVNDAQQNLDTLKNGPTADQLAVAENRVTVAQAALNQARLTAPFAGSITEVQVMPGDMVSPGKVAFRIDDLSTLYIDLQVSEMDIHSIQVSQPVSVTFDAIPDKTYTGKVTAIGLVGTADQGVVYFPVTVQLTSTDASVKSGMTAVASIIVDQVAGVLQVPNRAIQSNGSQQFVYVVAQDGTYQAVTVKVGMTSDTMSEITSSGVKEGDLVLLSVPTTTTNANRAFGGGGGGGGLP